MHSGCFTKYTSLKAHTTSMTNHAGSVAVALVDTGNHLIRRWVGVYGRKVPQIQLLLGTPSNPSTLPELRVRQRIKTLDGEFLTQSILTLFWKLVTATHMVAMSILPEAGCRGPCARLRQHVHITACSPPVEDDIVRWCF